MDKRPCTYILASTYKRLYIGVTSQLQTRVWEHQHPEPGDDSFTARYRIDRLVYYEIFDSMPAAIGREKQLKGWLRAKKIALIVAANPAWRDLSESWGKPVRLYEEGDEAYFTRTGLQPPR